MFFENPNEYCVDNLKKEDKSFCNAIEYISNAVFSIDCVEEFCNQFSLGSIERELLKEKLIPFVEFLSNKTDFELHEYIVSCIDKYKLADIHC